MKDYNFDEIRQDAKKEVFDDLKKMGYGFDNFSAGNKTSITEGEWKAFENKHLCIVRQE